MQGLRRVPNMFDYGSIRLNNVWIWLSMPEQAEYWWMSLNMLDTFQRNLISILDADFWKFLTFFFNFQNRICTKWNTSCQYNITFIIITCLWLWPTKWYNPSFRITFPYRNWHKKVFKVLRQIATMKQINCPWTLSFSVYLVKLEWTLLLFKFN